LFSFFGVYGLGVVEGVAEGYDEEITDIDIITLNTTVYPVPREKGFPHK